MGSQADLDQRLQAVLLEYGLEDEIPIPEAVGSSEVLAIVGSEDAAAATARALSALVESGAIVLYRGQWDAESDPVDREEGLLLLRDRAWFSYRIEDPAEQRLYFMNAANIRS